MGNHSVANYPKFINVVTRFNELRATNLLSIFAHSVGWLSIFHSINIQNNFLIRLSMHKQCFLPRATQYIDVKFSLKICPTGG